MIGYTVIGSNNLDKARAFYGELLGMVGAKEMFQMESGFTLYGTQWDQPSFAIAKPYNGEAATAGNGNMIALVVDERAKVDALYAKALSLGASCEGAPGLRGDEGDQAFYGAYFRDLDGNKLAVFRMGPA